MYNSFGFFIANILILRKNIQNLFISIRVESCGWFLPNSGQTLKFYNFNRYLNNEKKTHFDDGTNSSATGCSSILCYYLA